MRRAGVVLVGALVVFGAVAASGCSSERRSAADPSAAASVSSALTSSAAAPSGPSVGSATPSAASSGVASGGVPDAPIASRWRSLPTHEVQWSVWTPKDSVVTGVEAVVVNGTSPAEPVPCDADANAATQTGTYWTCSLIARQGQRTVRARAVNDSGVSEWTEDQVTFNRGSCTDAVAAAGACEEFDTGPGGGFVVYDAGTRQSWGQYLEAAPPGWSGSQDDPTKQWCAPGQAGYENTLATGTQIGAGASNTALIIQNCGTGTAAGLASAYRGGGKTDWFLPSKDELMKVYDRRGEIGALTDDTWWSSSQGSGTADDAWMQYFSLGPQNEDGKRWFKRVRPVRAF